MSFKSLMIVKAIVCLFFGIAFLAWPSKLLSIFGVTLGAGGIFPAREYGAALFGNLALTWFAREASESVARLAIIRALFVYDALGVVVTGIALYTGVLNQFGWIVIAVYLFFTLGFGYFLFVNPDAR